MYIFHLVKGQDIFNSRSKMAHLPLSNISRLLYVTVEFAILKGLCNFVLTICVIFSPYMSREYLRFLLIKIFAQNVCV